MWNPINILMHRLFCKLQISETLPRATLFIPLNTQGIKIGNFWISKAIFAKIWLIIWCCSLCVALLLNTLCENSIDFYHLLLLSFFMDLMLSWSFPWYHLLLFAEISLESKSRKTSSNMWNIAHIRWKKSKNCFCSTIDWSEILNGLSRFEEIYRSRSGAIPAVIY